MVAKQRYTQTNRHIAISTPLGKDALLLHSISGAEAISRLFQFQLDLLSVDDSIDFSKLVGQRVTVRIIRADQTERYWNGFVSRMTQGGKFNDDLTIYHAEIVPWLWFLTRTADCRIFQGKSVPEIIRRIFEELGFQDFELRLYGNYAPRDYCVQYRETDFNFLSRLMEEEGIFYFFSHDESKHKLILADDASCPKPCPEQQRVRCNLAAGSQRDEDTVTEWRIGQSFKSGARAHTDYNFETPSADLRVSMNGANPYEVYDYPGLYAKRAEGDSLAKIRLQEQTATAFEATGGGDCRSFISGFKFTLEDHYRGDMNREWLITSIHHHASHGADYRTGDEDTPEDFTYRNEFTCIPADVPFRPARITPRPTVAGCQTAVVVGPAGEEIYTDKYGRVKVQFHWDREGKRDENSSCWIRVSHPWAGKGWGALSIPRIGQEVVVDFLEGNPDAPLIVGRVYNAEQMPPFGMPARAVVSGIKSDSTKGGGGYNEISLDDTKGKEAVTIHAQYDMGTTVEHDDTQTVVSGDRTITIQAGKHTETIKGDTTITIQTGNHSLTVQTGTHTETIKGDTSVVVQTGAYSLDVQNNTHTHHVKGRVTENYDDAQATTVNGDIWIKSKTGEIRGYAAKEVFLHSGNSALSLKADGTITLAGKKIQLIGTDEVKLGVGEQVITLNKEEVVSSGTGIKTTAIGLHEISGALVKIN